MTWKARSQGRYTGVIFHCGNEMICRRCNIVVAMARLTPGRFFWDCGSRIGTALSFQATYPRHSGTKTAWFHNMPASALSP